ncbi:tryptophan synthase beta subunit-like PLP-dependent enzyme [Penicillium riverlandense]|uniref:tryptophan synthase beta subunit-like PLP-dependent enzyme n=1 Tax=Penicillium riverlandense TaxID=1903569 RepID=UPI002548314C|nr:tryptophan synthase beta subunit-like PLP-dependent enzyme [Penicillium riverlandense]KAJ5818405.1 tryptophan synthase beta subunit-like PLP-dependent enzyme [Penicillium riverlandense]
MQSSKNADGPKKPWIETPLIESVTLSQQAGCRVFLKLELLQPSGSFKSRGIGNFILKSLTSPANANKKVHFYISSGGNAGLAAIHAARDLGCACTVIVPHSTKPMMISKLHAAGADDVIQQGASWFEADTFLRENYINNQDAQTDSVNVYVPPFDDPLVWEGAASMVPEMVRQLPETNGDGFPADAIVCSVGGGGLFSGVVGGLEQYFTGQSAAKPVRVLAVETAGADSLAHSLRSGKLSSLKAITSQATSLGALCVAPKAFENARSPPSGVEVSSVVRSDADAARGIVRLADELRLQVELACGICVEVACGGRLKEVIPDLAPESRVVVVVCGGSNVTAEMIADYRRQIQEGWV